MNIVLPLLSGFVAAVIGIIPPGLINLTAAKVSLVDGKKRAMVFVLGALLVIFVQTYISVIFAQYINNHKEIVVLLREIGLVIFSLLSIYFLFKLYYFYFRFVRLFEFFSFSLVFLCYFRSNNKQQKLNQKRI